VTQSALIERGWTVQRIRETLGQPDKLGTGYHHAKLYDLRRVEAAELTSSDSRYLGLPHGPAFWLDMRGPEDDPNPYLGVHPATEADPSATHPAHFPKPQTASPADDAAKVELLSASAAEDEDDQEQL